MLVMVIQDIMLMRAGLHLGINIGSKRTFYSKKLNARLCINVPPLYYNFNLFIVPFSKKSRCILGRAESCLAMSSASPKEMGTCTKPEERSKSRHKLLFSLCYNYIPYHPLLKISIGIMEGPPSAWTRMKGGRSRHSPPPPSYFFKGKHKQPVFLIMKLLSS